VSLDRFIFSSPADDQEFPAIEDLKSQMKNAFSTPRRQAIFNLHSSIYNHQALAAPVPSAFTPPQRSGAVRRDLNPND